MADAGWFLREHRKARGLTLQALAERVGISVGYISDLESGKRRHNSDWIAKFAEALEIDPSELLRLPGGETQRMVPVVGFVGADTEGTVIYTTGQESGDLVPVPPGGGDESRALEVRGHSGGDFAPAGSIVYFDDQRNPPTPDMIGYPCVIETSDGRILLKRLLKGSSKGLYDLESRNGPTIPDVRILWAAEVTYVAQPRQARKIIRRAGERQVA